jgi:hypothetical protein
MLKDACKQDEGLTSTRAHIQERGGGAEWGGAGQKASTSSGAYAHLQGRGLFRCGAQSGSVTCSMHVRAAARTPPGRAARP